MPSKKQKQHARGYHENAKKLKAMRKEHPEAGSSPTQDRLIAWADKHAAAPDSDQAVADLVRQGFHVPDSD